MGFSPLEMCYHHLVGEGRDNIGLVSKPVSWTIKRWEAKLRGHLIRRQIEPRSLISRHEAVRKEMDRRGYKVMRSIEKSEFEEFLIHCGDLVGTTVDVAEDRVRLSEKCSKCRDRLK